MKPNKYGVIYSTPLPDKFFQTPEGLTHGIQVEPVDLTVNKRGSPPAAGGSPSSLKFPSHRRASPGLSMPSSSPPIKKYSPPSPGVQPFGVPLSMPPVMAAALSRHGIRSPGILPVIQPVVVQPVPFMYTSHLQQPLMVSLSEEMDNSNSGMPGKFCHAPTPGTCLVVWWGHRAELLYPQKDILGQIVLFLFWSDEIGRASNN
jgi:krueppel-like factor 3